MRRLPLLLVALLLVVAGVGCGGGEEVTPTPETVEGTLPQETGEGDGEGGEGNAENGQTVFAEAGCGGCHVLEAAGSEGTVGPSLDDADVSFEEAVQQIRQGGGGVPAYEGRLSDQEIADVAAFVTQG